MALGNGAVEIYTEFQRTTFSGAHTADCFVFDSWETIYLRLDHQMLQISLWSREKEIRLFLVLNRMEWPIRTISFSHDLNSLLSDRRILSLPLNILKLALLAKISTGKASSESRAGSLLMQSHGIQVKTFWHLPVQKLMIELVNPLAP